MRSASLAYYSIMAGSTRCFAYFGLLHAHLSHVSNVAQVIWVVVVKVQNDKGRKHVSLYTGSMMQPVGYLAGPKDMLPSCVLSTYTDSVLSVTA